MMERYNVRLCAIVPNVSQVVVSAGFETENVELKIKYNYENKRWKYL
jgi:hypothetical protein